MTLKELSAQIATPARMKAIAAALSEDAILSIEGLAGSEVSMIISHLPRQSQPTLVITNDFDEAGYVYHDMCQILGEEHVLIFPSGYKRDIKYGQIDQPQEILRGEVVSRWHSDEALHAVVTYPEALAERVSTQEEVERATVNVKVGQEHDLIDLAKRLVDMGFNRVDYVYEPGQLAVRGSILDVYSYSHELPYRIDFFGDEIDSIRVFNVETQLSEQKVEEVNILGESVGSQGGNDGISLLDFVADETLLVCRSHQWLLSRIEAVANEGMSMSAIVAEEGDLQAKQKIVDPQRFIKRFSEFKRIDYSVGAAEGASRGTKMAFKSEPQGIFHKNFDLIEETFANYNVKGYKVMVLSDSPKQIERLRAIFEDRDAQGVKFEPVEHTVHEGFVDHQLKLCVFTDHQIFDRFHKFNLKSDRARSGKLAITLKELQQLSVGDYVVHVDHGVGKFGGLVRTPINGTMQEMIKLTYLNDDIIFVSIHSLHKLAKYRGREGEAPRLNKLGSGAWRRIKERTKSRLKDIARDLIKLYAQRRKEKGFAFSPDSTYQQQLEASFIYEDTPDQIKTTAAVKADMESERPMDRLICGDVGFGKTEIAIRAAYKAALDGKQTAVLVPTTVLAFQHYHTFNERLKDFAVKVEYLSRARKPKDIKDVLNRLEKGDIDIIIGTHKLVGKSVKFHDLGLLVVDEEQKFGVAVKDRLKQLKVNVDTLTMSATPIPRTLQFSLMGARDLSAITTPPANRYPVQTSVMVTNDDIVSEAINFELSRNGQVFFVNNRIEQLRNLEHMIHRLVPDARVVVGHGQMPPEELEKAIVDFLNHDYDILLSTTIIESGIDMPNVNTIIINNAQNYGLSDLHQLRGRVGRSSRKAFCYLLVPSLQGLTTVARRRLQAIESFSDLGSGIHIALQDLDIRGAGNLLGAEQSGFIADLGYETYQKVLREAMIELRTEEFADTFADDAEQASAAEATGSDTLAYVSDTTVESDLELCFPPDYVAQQGERISLYQELDSIEREADIEPFRERLRDRFGTIPKQGEELINVVTLRLLAKTLGIEKIVLKLGKMYIYFVGEDNAAYYNSEAFTKIINYAGRHTHECQFRNNNGKHSIVVYEVPTVRRSVAILQEMKAMPAVQT